MTKPLPQMQALLEMMAKLRSPEGGCPWDLEQNFATIAPYTIEEAYEVADAITRGDMQDLRDELGDLLLQVVFHSQMAKEEGLFDFEQVARSIHEKMIRRHPHVFGDAHIATAEAQTENWEVIKEAERKGKATTPQSVLADVPAALPALMRAQKLQKRASRVGFDWPDTTGVIAKIREELNEVEQELAGGTRDSIEEELGDLLFAVANLARFMEVDSEEALRRANHKFTTRFHHIEAELAKRNIALRDAGLELMERLWNEAKNIEKAA